MERLKIKLKKYLGLICHTIYKSQVKYFIFIDIDTKDKEILRACMQEVARAGLSFWILETKKGYHVISPNMLNIIEWHRLKTSINKFLDNYYVFYVIRMINKTGDKFIGWYDTWDSGEYKISESFIKLINKRFKIKTIFKNENISHIAENSILNFNSYEHHEIQ